MAEQIGMAGLGFLGSAISANLLKAGFSIRGFDPESKRMDEHAERGGELADSPAEAAKGCRWFLACLPTSAITREVALGPGGIVEGAEEGLILVDTTTPRPEESESLAADLAPRGIHFLDACVSGTAAMAWKKDLVVVAGGEKADFEVSVPLFDGYARKAYFMGPVGSGARAKLTINLVLAGNRLALAEALTFGMKSGMDLENLLTVLQDSACFSKTMIDKGPKMVQGEYSREGQVQISLKGSRLMLEQGQRFGSPMLLTSLYSQIVQAAFERGDGEKDTSAFIEVLREMAGLTRRA